MSKPFTVLVGQSGGPTAAINASLAGVIETASAAGMRLLGMRYGIEGLLNRRILELGRELSEPMDLQLLRRTPASYLGSCRYKLPELDAKGTEVYERIFDRIEELGVDALLYIGGNDSMDTIDKLSRYAESQSSSVRLIGIPKTIDNDLIGTDHTPGYGSAAKFIATSVREIARDSSVYDLKSVTFVEIMGRNTGWLAGGACLASENGAHTPDLILLPERPLDEDLLLTRLENLLAQMNTVVVAVSEGVRRLDGTLLCDQGHFASDGTRLDAFGHEASLSGTGRYLASLTSHVLGVKTRAVELSTLQRCASHIASATDLAEAYALGGAGVLAARDGATAKMCALARLDDQPYLAVTDLVDVADVANHERPVPNEWIDSDGMGVTDAFRHYAAPLILDEVSPVFVGGLPHHIRPLVG